MAFLHGTNDAQKTMGVIALALYSTHHISSLLHPLVREAERRPGAGHRHLRGRVADHAHDGHADHQARAAQGFASQVTASLVLAFTARNGFPISTTHVISGSVMGAGATTKLSAVRWGVAANIVVAWVVTLPLTALVAAGLYAPAGSLHLSCPRIPAGRLPRFGDVRARPQSLAYVPVVTNGSHDRLEGTSLRLPHLRTVDEVVAELSEVERDALPAAACRALGDALALDEARFVTTTGEHGSWARAHHRRRYIRRHSVQTAVSGATERPLQWRDGNQTLLAVPVRRSGRRLAVLLGSVAATREFTERELHAGERVAAAAAEIEAEADLEAPSELRGRPLEAAVSEIEVGWAVVDALKATLEFDACRVYLPNPGDNRVTPVVQCGVGQAPHTELANAHACAPGVGAAGRAMIDGRSRIIANTRAEPHACKIVDSVAGDESLVVAPVRVDGTPVAVIVVARLGPGRFTRADLRAVERVAGRTAAGFRAVGLYRTASEQARVSQALLDLGEALGTQTGVDGMAGMLAIAAERLVECAAVSVWLRDGETMRLAAARGYTPAETARLAESAIPVAMAPFAGAVERREVVTRSAAPADAIASRLDGLPQGSTFAVVAVGERSANRAAIVVQRGPRRGAPSSLERQMLLGIADQTLIALTNRMLYAELDQSFLATVQALATALATNDEYTGEHANVLEELCTAVGHELGLGGEELRNVTLGAALHDIGKIGIPSPILRKPAPLTEEEWEVMRRHPELGARIIEPVPALDGARELVIACHEHWDGSGYPRGLAGELIPLGARIILACDAYHAMTSDRVYRAALPVSEAVLELQRYAGTQFDPAVADALIAVVGD